MKHSLINSSSKISGSFVLTFGLIGVALLLRGLFAWVSLENLPATSDEASNVLLAKMIFHGGSPLLFIGQPYQFPLEAYLMAPFVEWLPPTAFGARYQTLLLGLSSLFGFLLIIREAFPPGERWPAGLLVLFPSAYLLLFTSAYAPPQYSMSLTLTWIGIYLVFRYRKTSNKVLAFLAGIAGGLVFSNHLLTVTIVVGISALILFNGSVRRELPGILLFALGLSLGVIPYILALWLEPGAYVGLPKGLSLADMASRLVNPVLMESLPGAMGINPSLFPDFEAYLGWPYKLRFPFLAGYILLLVLLVAERLRALLQFVRIPAWPVLTLVDLALTASILTFCLFAYHQTDSSSFRYLLPAVWCFPFLLGHAYMRGKGHWKALIAGAAIVLAVFNVVTSAAVIRAWSKPEQVMKYADTPSLDSLLDSLKAKRITHCYASFWLAHRITYESSGEIVCTLPYNERFFHWPVPYKEEVDGAPDAVYVLSEGFGARLTASAFQKHIKVKGIDAKTYEVKADEDSFLIFYDFDYPPAEEERPLRPDEYVVRTNNDTGETGGRDLGSIGMPASSSGEREDEWLEVDFKGPQIITGITLMNIPLKTREKENIRIFVRDDGDGGAAWRLLSHDAHLQFERLGFHHNRPIYDTLSQFIRVNQMRASGLRVEIREVDKKRQRGFPDIEILGMNHEKF